MVASHIFTWVVFHLCYMHIPNYAGANFYNLIQPVKVRIDGLEVPSSVNQGLPPLQAQPKSTRQVVVITGRGRTEGRSSHLIRLRPEIVKEIKCLVDGPLYLTIELALRHYAKELRTRQVGSVEMIKAADLG